MRIATYIALFIGGLVVGYLMLASGLVNGLGGVPSHQKDPVQGVSIYLSFISVMLTAITVVLAALALGIGLVAAYTFKELKNEAQSTSKSISEATAKSVSVETAKSISESTARLIASQELSEVRVRKIVEELYLKAEQDRQSTEEWGEDPSDKEER